MDNLAA